MKERRKGRRREKGGECPLHTVLRKPQAPECKPLITGLSTSAVSICRNEPALRIAFGRNIQLNMLKQQTEVKKEGAQILSSWVAEVY